MFAMVNMFMNNISVEDFHKMVAIFCKEIREHKIEELHKKIQDS